MAQAFLSGFLRDTTTGALICTTDDTGAVWGTGFLRSPTGELIVTTDDTNAIRWAGFLRSPTGALVIGPDDGSGYESGHYRNSAWKLVVTEEDAGGEWAGGFIRNDDLLVVSGLVFTEIALASEPVAYYRLGEASGATTAVDSAGANDGTYSGSPTLETTGLVGDADTAMTCDGTNDLVALPQSDFVGINADKSFSLGVWLKHTMIVNNNWAIGIGQHAAGGNALVGIANDRAIGTNEEKARGIKAYYRNDAAQVAQVLTDSGHGAFNDGVAHFAVLTADGTDLRLYVDADEIGSAVIPSGTITVTRNTIGALVRDTTALHFAGVLDEVGFWNRPLSAGEIRSLFDSAGA